MFGQPTEPYVVDPDIARTLDVLFILHADHEQNCSTSTVRMVGSAQTNLFASITAGICALWGPLHGGANQSVLEMLTMIRDSGLNMKEFISKVKDKSSDIRLMGFGHRVYKNFDPRATIIKKQCDIVLNKLGIQDPLLDVAKESSKRRLRTSISSSVSFIQTSISTQASSTKPLAFQPTCLRSFRDGSSTRLDRSVA